MTQNASNWHLPLLKLVKNVVIESGLDEISVQYIIEKIIHSKELEKILGPIDTNFELIIYTSSNLWPWKLVHLKSVN